MFYNCHIHTFSNADVPLKSLKLCLTHFGSDFYIIETEATERCFGLDLRAFIDEGNFEAIAVNNPKAFSYKHMATKTLRHKEALNFNNK